MFITFEGIEGSSKSTQARLLSGWLADSGKEHILTKEPGSVISKECQQIRHLLLSPEYDISSKAELFLYLADRSQHVQNHIKPALEKGTWVVSDRYWLSTYVYQGFGRGLINKIGNEFFTSLLHYAADNLMPDITFVMDLPVEVGLSRARSSNEEYRGGDRMELENMGFHQRLRTGFLKAVELDSSERYVVLDATKSIEELHEEVKKVLQHHVE